MSTNEFVGLAIVIGVPLLGGIIALIKPIIDLNKNLTQLNMTCERLIDDNKDIRSEVKNHGEQLEDHEKRIYFMEHKEKSL